MAKEDVISTAGYLEYQLGLANEEITRGLILKEEHKKLQGKMEVIELEKADLTGLLSKAKVEISGLELKLEEKAEAMRIKIK